MAEPGKGQEEYCEADYTAEYPGTPLSDEAAQPRTPYERSAIEPDGNSQ